MTYRVRAGRGSKGAVGHSRTKIPPGPRCRACRARWPGARSSAFIGPKGAATTTLKILSGTPYPEAGHRIGIHPRRRDYASPGMAIIRGRAPMTKRASDGARVLRFQRLVYEGGSTRIRENLQGSAPPRPGPVLDAESGRVMRRAMRAAWTTPHLTAEVVLLDEPTIGSSVGTTAIALPAPILARKRPRRDLTVNMATRAARAAHRLIDKDGCATTAYELPAEWELLWKWSLASRRRSSGAEPASRGLVGAGRRGDGSEGAAREPREAAPVTGRIPPYSRDRPVGGGSENEAASTVLRERGGEERTEPAGAPGDAWSGRLQPLHYCAGWRPADGCSRWTPAHRAALIGWPLVDALPNRAT